MLSRVNRWLTYKHTSLLIGLEVVSLVLVTAFWAGSRSGGVVSNQSTFPGAEPDAGTPATVADVLAATASAEPKATPSGPAASSAEQTSLPTVVEQPTNRSQPSPTPLPAGVSPVPPATVSVVAAGEIACDPASNVGQPKDCEQAATADLIGQLHPTAVLTLGDHQYAVNSLSAYQAVFDSTWGRYKSIIHPTIGSDEYLTAGAAGYFAYFGFPPYYSYNLGDWHIISLDSECDHVGGCQAGSAQEQWLLADLASHRWLCTLVAYNEPAFSSGEHGNGSQMDRIWADLVAAHVEVVLNGHNHDYERFAPLAGNGRPNPRGTMEFVVGTGGKGGSGFTAPPLIGEDIRSDSTFGVLDMTLGQTGFSWRFVPAPGYAFTDSGSASCQL